MNTTQTKVDLLYVLRTQIVEGKPRRAVPSVLVEFVESAIADATRPGKGYFSPSEADPSHLMRALFVNMLPKQAKMVKAGSRTIPLAAALLPRILSEMGVKRPTFEIVVKSALQALDLRANDLRLEWKGSESILTSTATFERSVGVNVEIPLSTDEWLEVVDKGKQVGGGG